MNTEHSRILEEMVRVGNEVTRTRESATRFLIEAGILTEAGALSPNYDQKSDLSS